MNEMKRCKGCGVEKIATTEFFHKAKTKDGLNSKCKLCIKEYQQGRKEQMRENQRKWREKNRESYREYHANWREKNREKVNQIAKEYYYRNHDKILEKYDSDEYKEYQEKWRAENHDKVKGYKKKWADDNRGYHNDWEREKRNSDPCYRLRKNVSRAVSIALQRTENSKGGQSTFDHLPYNVEQLREHLESQFDEHMTWDNYGTYWHVDHIYPQSLLPYDTMDHPNFLRCWGLENLQPLEAIENIRKSNKLL